MAIEQQLDKHKDTITKKWFDLLAATYPQETVRLFNTQSDPFANPVGHTFRTAIGEIVDEFFGQNRPETLAPLLDKVIRVRAVQSFSPSAALSFVFGLKAIVEEALEEELAEGETGSQDLREFERKVEGLGLLAFDVYSRCRENLYEIKIEEIKSNTRRLLERAQLIVGD
ncbi:MAG: RsbRD N-terminal domain-containing protein [Syntrophobacteraceae bacterium]